MKKLLFLSIAAFVLTPSLLRAQNTPTTDFYNSTSHSFWNRVQFGGTGGLVFGDGFSNVTIAPSAIYPVTEQFSAGVGLQYNYAKSRDYFESQSYGISFIGLYNPIPEIQLSAELEQLRVNNKVYYYDYRDMLYSVTNNFWNTALFLGAGYSSGNATIGIRYNVLFNKDNHVYEQAWMPFVRVYF